MGLALVAAAPDAAHGQEPTVRQRLAVSVARDTLPALLAERGAAVGGDVGALLAASERPDVGTDRWRLLKGLDVGVVSFEGAGGERRGLGVVYDWSHDLVRTRFRLAAADQSGSRLALTASGHAAFDPDINPRDFLDAGARYAFYASRGGVRNAPRDAPALATALNALEDRMAVIADRSALRASPLARAYVDSILSYLTTQAYVSLAANAHVEADQRFDRRQTVYGALLALEVKAWNPRSALARANVLDWPFAAVRWLSRTDEHFQVLGASLPSVQLELAQVDPANDTLRTRLGASRAYPRARLEVSFRTPILDGPTGRVYVESDVRVYQELHAREPIRRAGVARYSYVSVAAVSRRGPFVSYTDGRLPFDRTQDRVYELGFRTHF